MGYYSWYGQIGKYFYLSNINFDDKSLSKLSENQKIIEIVSTEFKLWQLKDSSENRPDSEKTLTPSPRKQKIN